MRPRATRALYGLAVALVVAVRGPWAPAASASILSSGLQLVERNYLFAGQLDAQRLLGEALIYVEARLPEVEVVETDAGGRVVIAGPCHLRLELAPDARVTDLDPVLHKAAVFIDGCLVDRPEGLPSTESLLLTGVLSALDPYSTLFDAEHKAEHTIQFEGALAGIGARIGVRDEKLTLLSIYEGSPAALAGLHDGDVISRVDGASTVSMLVADAVQRIRGNVGTPVNLEIERTGTAEHLSFAVNRGLVTIPSVQASRLEGDIVYAAVSHFSQTTPADFRSRVGRLVSGGGVRGVIIDLRDNSGGSMLGSAAIADLFLDDGILITTSGRNGVRVPGLTAEIRATKDTPFRELPLAILMSPRTASGSELLAASLRMHDRATLVGERTFGKGTVQKTYGLENDSSLKLTVGHFLPNGLAIPGIGLSPDIEFRILMLSESEVTLSDDRTVSELPFWLQTPEWLTPANVRPAAIVTTSENAAGDAESIEASPEDAVVGLARELLMRFGSTSTDHTLARARGWLKEQGEKADRKLSAKLAERSIDWRAAPDGDTSVRDPSKSLQISIAPEHGVLRAGERSALVVTVRNAGDTPVFRVYGHLSSDAAFLDGAGLLLGYLAPGAERSWSVAVEPPAALRTSRFAVRAALHGDPQDSMESSPEFVGVEEGDQPRLSHRVEVLDGDAPGVLRLRVSVRNLGAAAAEQVRVFLKHPETDAVELIQATGRLERLAPGDSRDLNLEVKLLESTETPIRLGLIVSEAKFHGFYEATVPLARDRRTGKWQGPPRVRITRLVPSGDASYRLVAEVRDPDGITTVWCQVDRKKTNYVDARGAPKRKVTVSLPWKPSPDGQRIEIEATDVDGIKATYITEL